MRTPKATPSQSELQSLIIYDPLTGEVRWKTRPEITKGIAAWNARFAGKLAGGKAGMYRWISIHDENYLLHRIIFKLVMGHDTLVVDHKDGDKLNNKWDNLRVATQSQNRCNAIIGKKLGKSGVKGVSQRPNGRWKGRVTLRGQFYETAAYDTVKEAEDAVKALREKIHGEFARD